MQKKLSLKNLGRFTRGKLVMAFLVAGIAIVFSWMISRVVFSDIETSVNELAAPSDRLMIVNRLIEKVSRLDQLQRIRAIRQPALAHNFLKETRQIRLTLDTLAEIYALNDLISLEVDSMKQVLDDRDRVYIDYISLRANQQNNPELSRQLKSISGLIRKNDKAGDSMVVTTQNRITTTAAPKKKPQESLWKRIFGKRSKEEQEEFVREELNIKVDTISVARQNKMAKDIDEAVSRITKEQTIRNSTMLLQELDLVNNSNFLVNKLWNLLHKIQEDEINRMRKSSASAIDYFNTSINNAGLILMLFFLVIAGLVYAVLTDLTKSNQYRVQLQAAKDEAEHASVMKQRFLSNMSHEIRTPLQSIIGFSEQVKDQARPDPKMTAAIHTSAGHLLHIVNEILDYSRIISGKFVLENRVFNLSNLAAEVAQNMSLQAESKHLTFSFVSKISPSLHVNGDDFRIRQVLYNLLGNAVKFTGKGGVFFSVEEQQNGLYKLTVTDSGTGISKENLTRIFNEFEQTDESISRKFGGTGLGLSISRSLVETMGGRIEVESEPGKGTTFSVILPLSVTQQQMHRYESLPQHMQVKNSYTVVVDDDAFILDLCDTILTKHRIAHACYGSAEELLNSAWNAGTRIVFTDMRLPGKNGAELMKAIRLKTKDVKIIALTAQALPEEKAKLINEGFDAVLAKPFREHELLSFYATDINDEELHADKARLDLSLLKKMTMNDQELITAHLHRFAEETSKDLELLKADMRGRKREEVYEIVHKLAGRIGQVGSKELMIKYRELEQALQQKQTLASLEIQLNEAVSDTADLISEVLKMQK